MSDQEKKARPQGGISTDGTAESQKNSARLGPMLVSDVGGASSGRLTLIRLRGLPPVLWKGPMCQSLSPVPVSNVGTTPTRHQSVRTAATSTAATSLDISPRSAKASQPAPGRCPCPSERPQPSGAFMTAAIRGRPLKGRRKGKGYSNNDATRRSSPRTSGPTRPSA